MTRPKKFLPGDKVYIKPNYETRASWPHGLGYIVQRRGLLNEYSFRPAGSSAEHAWYPAEDICLINRKGVTFAMLPEAAHVKLKLQGSTKKVEMLHWILATLDPDWPWTPSNAYSPVKHCGACAGAIYDHPNFSADDIRILVKQLDGVQRVVGGLKVEIKKFNVQARCTKDTDKDKEPALEVVV